MFVRSLIAVLILLLAGSCASIKPTRTARPPDATGQDENEALARIVESTRDLQGFTATYQATVDGSEQNIRLSYLAPNRARLEFWSDERAVSSWLIDRETVLDTEYKNKSTRAVFSYDEEPFQNAEFATLFGSEFPKPETGADDRGPGPSFLIELEPDPESAEHGSLLVQLMWSKHRAHLFRWFASLEDWRHAREEGERLVRDVGGGGRVYLSLESGLIDEMTHPGGMHLKLVEWRRTADDSQFVIPEPKEGTEDVTEKMVRHFARSALPKRRVLLYKAALGAKEHSPGDTEQLREKLTRVFEALYRPETVRNYGKWMAKTAAATEEYAAWYGEQHDRHADDPATWKTVEDMGAQRRTELDEVLSRGIKMWAERIDPPDPEMGDPAFLATIADVERETLRSVYQREIATPLLEGFDEAIRSVGGGE